MGLKEYKRVEDRVVDTETLAAGAPRECHNYYEMSQDEDAQEGGCEIMRMHGVYVNISLRMRVNVLGLRRARQQWRASIMRSTPQQRALC